MGQATEVATTTIVAMEEAMAMGEVVEMEVAAMGHRKQRRKRKMILTTMEVD